jgi:NAD(P)-dependent dehydrogenase (short-subunit alcohol dehydrogenase family)
MASDNAFGIPSTSGFDFTQTLHSKAEGPTDPANNKPKGPFVVCVTGAGKGLGFHISLAYAKAGVTGLAISSRTQSDLDTLTAELKKVNPKLDILAQLCDTMKDEDVKKLAKATKDRFGRVDVCIANAGVISKYLSDGSLPKGIVADLDFERVIDINLLGSVRVAREFTPLLLESKGARTFIVITSLAAHFTHSNLTPIAYNVSKQAACNLVEHMENDHGKDGLISYAVHPGAVLTPQTEHHSLEKGDIWEKALVDDIGLCGGFLTWLTNERRQWLSGRYLAVTWDVEELEKKKDDIVNNDLLKFKMAV